MKLAVGLRLGMAYGLGVLDETAVAPGLGPPPALSLIEHLQLHPADAARYRHLRRTAGRFRPSQYDVSQTCNLTCEGCLFFAGADGRRQDVIPDPALVDAFFAGEKARGVNFLQFGGAEPGLAQETLRIAARYVDRGVVFTNGTIRIARDIPFKLHISIWGLGAEGQRLRGADVVDKAVRNYRGDPRALFVFTVNASNIASIPDVAAYCAEQGVPLTFSHFSPTVDYDQWRRGEAGADTDYFKSGAEGADAMMLTPASLADSRRLILEAMQAYPGTVVYNRALLEAVHDPAGLYEVDPETGVALDCGSRVTERYRHFHVDLSDAGEVKCCAPGLGCGSCRLYIQSLATLLGRLERYERRPGGVAEWLDLWELWCRFTLVGWSAGAAPAN
jgi:hypothetical protein